MLQLEILFYVAMNSTQTEYYTECIVACRHTSLLLQSVVKIIILET